MRIFKSTVSKHFSSSPTLMEILKLLTKMDEKILMDAIHKGAVWNTFKGKTLRIRNPHEVLKLTDTISFFYDPKVLGLKALTEAKCLYECDHYGIWFKNSGVVSQGSQTGDHASLLRYIELKKKKEIFLIHRLDRETSGLMIFGYDSKAAAKLGHLFQKELIDKEYEAIVLGEMIPGKEDIIVLELDGKKAITHYKVLETRNNQSLLRIKLETGRLHQIRRHMDMIGHPIMGDPKYGRRNKNSTGLKLIAKTLGFTDPWTGKSVSWASHEELTF
jgi:tRNA pseudouridine32 synthase/23S rRNA pseudouridine746 synthase